MTGSLRYKIEPLIKARADSKSGRQVGVHLYWRLWYQVDWSVRQEIRRRAIRQTRELIWRSR